MPRQKKQGATVHAAPAGGIDAEATQVITNEYCLLNYGTSYVGGVPYRLSLPDGEVWIVPVVLTSPGHGMVGEVGMLAVNARTGKVVGATPRDEARAAGTELAREKRHDLDAAFRRARET
jgi:hypothetical protein